MQKTLKLDEIGWLNNLFIRFGAIWNHLWTYNQVKTTELLSKKLEWYGALNGFRENVIDSAIDLARDHFAKPPSIKEFVDLCQTESKRLKHDRFQLEDCRRAPPSPLLAEYMAKNGSHIDPEFLELKSKYSGKELGSEMIKLIKRKIGKTK